MPIGADVAVDAVKGVVKDVDAWLHDAHGGRVVNDSMFAQTRELGRTPQGMEVHKMLNDYIYKSEQATNTAIKPARMVQDAIKNDPSKLNATVGQLHADFSATKHPMAAYTKELLKADPEHNTRNMGQVVGAIRAKADLMAGVQVFGEDKQNLISKLMPLYDSPDETMHAHANAIHDIVANQLHDTRMTREGAPASGTKLSIKKALELEDRYRLAKGAGLSGAQKKAAGLSPLPYSPEAMKTDAVYQGSNAIERYASHRVRMFLAPLIAINHMSTFANSVRAPLESTMKAMVSMGDTEIRQLVDASSTFASIESSMLGAEIRASQNLPARLAGRPEVGRLMSSMFHNPGFNFIRRAQLRYTGTVGYHAAGYWAEAAVKGDKVAISELKDMQLDPDAIIKRGGKLNEEELKKAIFHFTNNRVFIRKPLDRALNATRNPWVRMLTMFHGYVSSQQAFMRHELDKMVKAKDYVGIAKYAASVGILFPVIAPMLKSAMTLGRTGSPSQAGQGLEQDYRKLTAPKDAGEFTSEYLDMLSYYGTFGTMHSFFQAAHSDRLALALMGPIAGSGVRATQDVINYATKPDKSGKRNPRPIAKDILQQTVPVAGNIAANKLFPAKEHNQE